MTSKTIYLDFDGVLHPDGTEAIDDRGRLVDNPVLFCWLPILADILDPYPDVRLIVSSDWRRLFDDPTLIRLLDPLGNRFAGVIERPASPRAQEILIDAQSRGLTDWIALDDHKSVHQAARTDPRFIACDPTTGITDAAVQLAVRAWLTAGLDEHHAATLRGIADVRAGRVVSNEDVKDWADSLGTENPLPAPGKKGAT